MLRNADHLKLTLQTTRLKRAWDERALQTNLATRTDMEFA
jgi:hypothetical protein